MRLLRRRCTRSSRPVSPAACFYAICFEMNAALILLVLGGTHGEAGVIVDVATARRATSRRRG
jgi:hypothetical protein